MTGGGENELKVARA